MLEYRRSNSAVLIMAGAMAFAILSCNLSGGDEPPTPEAKFLEDITPSNAGLPLPETRFNTLSKVMEYFVLGTAYNNAANQTVVDPYKCYLQTSLASTFPDSLTAPTQEILYSDINTDLGPSFKKAAAAGNFDNDHYDETVIVSWNPANGDVKVSIVDFDGATMNTDVVLSSLPISAGSNLGCDYSVAIHDMDGDGYDEIVIGGSLVDDSRSAGRLWILDDASTNYAVLKSIILYGNTDTTGSLGVKKLKVAAGAMDKARNPYMVAAWYDASVVHQTSSTSYGTIETLETLVNGYVNYQVMTPDGTVKNSGKTSSPIMNKTAGTNPNLFNVALADVDGDTLPELVFAAVNSETYSGHKYQGMSEYVLDDMDKNFVAMNAGMDNYKTWCCDGAVDSYPEQFLQVLDYNGSGNDELLIGPYLWEYEINRFICKTNLSFVANNYLTANSGNINFPVCEMNSDIADIKVGDINGDTWDDVIVLYKNGRVKSYGWIANADGTPNQWKNYDNSGTGTTAVDNAILVPVNVDNDSTVVEYRGKSANATPVEIEESHTVEYRDVKLVAVIAGPPTLTEDKQNLNNSGTSLGTGSSTSHTVGGTFSNKVGVTFGTEVSVSAGFIANVEVLRVEVALELEVERAATADYTHEVSETFTNTCAAGEDLVICMAVPCDVYTYVTVSHPDPGSIGKTVTVSRPQAARYFAMTRDVFNASTTGIKVLEGLLPNKAYNLNSFPQGQEGVAAVLANESVTVEPGIELATQIDELGRSSKAQIVQQGNGSSSTEVEISDTFGWGASLTFTAELSASTVVSGVKVGGKASNSFGVYYEGSTSTSTIFCGEVGAIPDVATYNTEQYNWGVFAYKQKLLDENGKVMQDFIVVNYWVEQ